MNYLVRTEDRDGKSHLLLFADTLTPAQEQLTDFLSFLIEENRHGLGPLVTGIWRWNDDDSRDELTLEFLEEVSEMENTDWKWEVRIRDPKKPPEVICGFTVTIPAKGQ